MPEVLIIGLAAVVARLDAVGSGALAVSRTMAVVGTDTNYAPFVHNGTAPHVIEPSTKKALAWPGGLHPVKRVNHPGYKGNPFLTDALEAQREPVTQLVSSAVAEVADGAPPGVLAESLYAAGLLVQGDAMQRANVRTGNLRRSLHTEVMAKL